jgi:hypothetical protein
MQAMFPGMKCQHCGAEINPGTEIDVHPTLRGPQGGKRYIHANPSQCSGARSNPRRRKKAAPKTRTTRTRRNPSTSAKLEALAKKHGLRSKAGKLAMDIAKDLKRQGL